MKTKIFIICSFWLLLSLLSCDRKLIDQGIATEADGDILIREAQTYFQTLTSHRARIASYDIPLPKEWLDNRMPQWAQAVTFTSDGENVVEVPLLYNNIDPVYTFKSEALGAQGEITQRNGVTKALFFKHKDGSIAIYIMKLILDPIYLAKVKANNQYKSLSFNTVNENFSGIVILSAWNEKLLDMYVFKDGKIKARTRPRDSSNQGAAGARKRQCYYNPKCDRVCIGLSSNCCTPEDEAYNPTGWCCNESWSSCTYQCIYDEICYPDDHLNEPITGPSGDTTPTDPGDGNTGISVDINDSNLKPCMQDIMTDVEKLANGSIGDIIKKFSNNENSKYNWKLIDGKLPPNINAQTSQRFDAASKIVTTIFDGEKFSKASDLSIARTIIHESIHAYLINHFRVEPGTANAAFPKLVQDYANQRYGGNANAIQHEEFARQYVNEIANALSEFDILRGYTHPRTYYEDLAWGGLEGTDAFTNLGDEDKQRIRDRILIELTGKDSKGISQGQIGRDTDCN